MAALTANQELQFRVPSQEANYPVKDAATIYKGSAVGLNTGDGYARNLNAGDPFLGFAIAKADNASGADGDINVTCITKGVVKATISSVAITDVGKAVYMSDDQTFTLTQGSNTYVGTVVRYDTTDTVDVAFDVYAAPQAGVAELTDSSGGTAADTIAAIGASYDQAEVQNAVASLAAKINYLLRVTG